MKTDNERSLFLRALELKAAERATFLDREGAGNDAALRRQVEALLRAAENAGDFLEAPPTGLSRDADATRLVTELSSE